MKGEEILLLQSVERQDNRLWDSTSVIWPAVCWRVRACGKSVHIQQRSQHSNCRPRPICLEDTATGRTGQSNTVTVRHACCLLRLRHQPALPAHSHCSLVLRNSVGQSGAIWGDNFGVLKEEFPLAPSLPPHNTTQFPHCHTTPSTVSVAKRTVFVAVFFHFHERFLVNVQRVLLSENKLHAGGGMVQAGGLRHRQEGSVRHYFEHARIKSRGGTTSAACRWALPYCTRCARKGGRRGEVTRETANAEGCFTLIVCTSETAMQIRPCRLVRISTCTSWPDTLMRKHKTVLQISKRATVLVTATGNRVSHKRPKRSRHRNVRLDKNAKEARVSCVEGMV